MGCGERYGEEFRILGFGWRGEEEIIGFIFRKYVSGFRTARSVY